MSTSTNHDGLLFDYTSLAGFTLPYLPHFESSVKKAFPGMTVQQQTITTYGRGKTPVMSVLSENSGEVLFHIHRAGDTEDTDGTWKWCGFSASVIIDNARPIIFGKYRVGETRFKDFTAVHLAPFDEAGTSKSHITETHIVCRGGLDKDELYNARLVFSPPKGFSGDLIDADESVLAEAVLTEVRFYFSHWQAQPVNIVDEQGGLALLSKDLPKQGFSLRNLFGSNKKQGASIVDEAPVVAPLGSATEVQKKLYVSKHAKEFSKENAQEAYLRLADILIYSAPHDAVKKGIPDALSAATKEDPIDFLWRISDIRFAEYDQTFFIVSDYTGEVSYLTSQLKGALAAAGKHADLPSDSEYPENASISYEGVMDRITKALAQQNVDMYGLDTLSDTLILCLADVKHRMDLLGAFATLNIDYWRYKV